MLLRPAGASAAPGFCPFRARLLPAGRFGSSPFAAAVGSKSASRAVCRRSPRSGPNSTASGCRSTPNIAGTATSPVSNGTAKATLPRPTIPTASCSPWCSGRCGSCCCEKKYRKSHFPMRGSGTFCKWVREGLRCRYPKNRCHSCSKLGVKKPWPSRWRISFSAKKRPPASSAEGRGTAEVRVRNTWTSSRSRSLSKT